MSRFTKVSNSRTGAPKFGRRGHRDHWDNSVKTYQLSQEELAAYRNGERGGTKYMTYEEFQSMQEKGMTMKAIADKAGCSVATLYNKAKAWKQQAAKTDEPKPVEEAPVTKVEPVVNEEVNLLRQKIGEKNDRIAEYTNLMNNLKMQLMERDELVGRLEAKITELTKPRISQDYDGVIESLQKNLSDSARKLRDSEAHAEAWERRCKEERASRDYDAAALSIFKAALKAAL
ncbi:hypothetical protein LRR81_08785 [Metabacillus sp. GX 13764]|uniref:hypothetical protein n=1 Tax=Metabacillus kandeliae TaxID=2900151 RepID=UPI001E587802|nr:hypothetical protein [Metabacillus kandeliae]MCD7034329.1 hypothetical protein [Metabacillus kandeliae]